MSEKELNSYRFNSGQEPSDEMLAQIMKEVALEAAEKYKKAVVAHFEEMRRMVASNRAVWQERIKSVTNG